MSIQKIRVVVVILALALGFLATPGPTSTCQAGFIGLGQAGNFAVLGLGDTDVMIFSNDIVNGNVGLSGTSSLTNQAPSTINGDVYRESGATVTGPGTITGSIIIQDMTAINNDALLCSSTDGALTPTQTFGAISANTTVTGNGGLNIIKINGGIDLGDSQNLILHGTASDIFVVNVTGSVTMNGSSQLGVSGGVTDTHVLWNFIGASGNVSLQVGNAVHGTMLGPNYSLTNGDGTYNGGMIFGGSPIKLLSGATVTHETFTPEPATLSLLALGGLALIRRRRRA